MLHDIMGRHIQQMKLIMKSHNKQDLARTYAQAFEVLLIRND